MKQGDLVELIKTAWQWMFGTPRPQVDVGSLVALKTTIWEPTGGLSYRRIQKGSVGIVTSRRGDYFSVRLEELHIHDVSKAYLRVLE